MKNTIIKVWSKHFFVRNCKLHEWTHVFMILKKCFSLKSFKFFSLSFFITHFSSLFFSYFHRFLFLVFSSLMIFNTWSLINLNIIIILHSFILSLKNANVVFYHGSAVIGFFSWLNSPEPPSRLRNTLH